MVVKSLKVFEEAHGARAVGGGVCVFVEGESYSQFMFILPGITCCVFDRCFNWQDQDSVAPAAALW